MTAAASRLRSKGTTDRITATFRVVTPMFLGGADQTADPFRVPSIKGVLRFWWRAFAYPGHWRRARDEPEPAAASDIQERAMRYLAAAESRLFGSTSGQAQILMRITGSLVSGINRAGEVLFADDRGRGIYLSGLRYLGYGVIAPARKRDPHTKETLQNQGEILRDCIQSTSTFKVEFLLKSSMDEEDRGQIVTAIKAFGLLGGLGARSRRGFGSVSLTALDAGAEQWRAPRNDAEYFNQLKIFLVQPLSLQDSDPGPPFTAFGKESGVAIVGTKPGEIEALNWLGESLQLYRSRGFEYPVGSGYTVQGRPPQFEFWDDYRNFYQAQKAPGSNWAVPRRVIFGLPQNYKGDIQLRPLVSNRRASPLLVHVHHLCDKSYAIVLCWFPAQFLPAEGEENTASIRRVNSRIDKERDRQSMLSDGGAFWDVLRQFVTAPHASNGKYLIYPGDRPQTVPKLDRYFPNPKVVK